MTAECFDLFLLEEVTTLFGSNHGFIGDVFVCTSLSLHLSSRQADPMAGNWPRYFCLITVCSYLLQLFILLAVFLACLGEHQREEKGHREKMGCNREVE